MNRNYNVCTVGGGKLVEELTRQDAVNLVILWESEGKWVQLYNMGTRCIEYESPLVRDGKLV